MSEVHPLQTGLPFVSKRDGGAWSWIGCWAFQGCVLREEGRKERAEREEGPRKQGGETALSIKMTSALV